MTDEQKHISIHSILNLLPNNEITQIGQALNVDFHVRKLSGEIFLQLLIFGQLLSLKLSQRKLNAIYDSPFFRAINQSVSPEEVTHQSICARQKSMPSEYFRDIYESLCSLYGNLLPKSSVEGDIVCAVDSTMVSETAAKLREGMTLGKKPSSKAGKKLVKYTMIQTSR